MLSGIATSLLRSSHNRRHRPINGDRKQFCDDGRGGIDFKVSRHISVRLVEAEYFLTKIPDGLNNRQNNFRFSAGVVFRFGQEQCASSGLGACDER
jgi:hypothetical protein